MVLMAAIVSLVYSIVYCSMCVFAIIMNCDFCKKFAANSYDFCEVSLTLIGLRRDLVIEFER